MADIIASKLLLDDGNALILRDADAQAKVATLEEDMSSKAEIDGYYEDMTVGDAEQLVASQYVEDSVPYQFRTTGGSADVGNREYADAVVGGTVAWNQLVQSASVGRVNGELTYDQNTNTHTFIAAGTDSRIYNNYAKTLNHVYLTIATVTSSVSGTLKNEISFGWANKQVSITADTPLAFSSILKVASGTEPSPARSPQFFIQNMSSYTLSIKDWMFFDLTQMFGSTIADYIYSLEQATAGAGVAWFKKLFPKDYYEYNAGELLSVSGLASHNTVGFNQWDEEWVNAYHTNAGAQVADNRFICSKNKIPVLPNTAYYFKSPSVDFELYEYGADGSFIMQSNAHLQNATFTTGSNTYFIEFSTRTANALTTYNHDICINLSWSGWRNGEYEAYQKHSYPLDDSLTLRGIPKLDAQNNLYYDGDEYLPDGTVNRRYYEFVLTGDEDYFVYSASYIKSDACNAAIANVDYMPCVSYETYLKARCNKLIPADFADLWSTSGRPNYFALNDQSKQLHINLANSLIGVTDPSQETQVSVRDKIKAYIKSQYDAGTPYKFILELATPTTETAEPYQQIQVCDDFGTEEYVSTSIVPVGHNTRYPANLRDKLQHLPDLADDDGYYMIGQSNKQMHLELFRIPKAPTTDGTYTLKATVSGGTPTYTWEAQA